MFNWVCPRCGRENSPSYIECPDCKELEKRENAQAEAEAQAAAQIAPQPVYGQPGPTQPHEWQPPYQQPGQPQQPVYSQPPQHYAQPPYPPQQPPQYAPQQPYGQPPQYQPPQQYPPQYQQPQYPPQYPQTPQYVPQQQQPQYAPPVQQYAPQQMPVAAPVAPVSKPAAQAATKPTAARPTKPLYVEPAAEPGFAAKLNALPMPLLMLLFAGLFLVVGAGGYFAYQKFGKNGFASGSALPAAAATKPKMTNPIQKYIEVVGIRLTTDAKKKPVAKFVIVNHANTEVSNLGANVTVWASTSRSEEDSIGSFTFHVDNIKPYESKEMSAPFNTKLKMYELPDWQNATAEVGITSPQP
jgi:hypothetical protein